jgi:hypothetical protein
MPPVKFFESLDLDPIGLFLNGKTSREREVETKRNTIIPIETRKNTPATMVIIIIRNVPIPTAAVRSKSVMITAKIVDTECALMKKTATTRITTITGIGMNTKGIGNLGSNGTVTRKNTRRSANMEVTTTKTII